MGKQYQTLFLGGSKITADGNCSHEIKGRLLLEVGPLLSQPNLLSTGPGFWLLPGPLRLAPWGILIQNPHPVCAPLHQNGAPVWLISILWFIWRLLKQTLGDPQQ